MKLAPTSRLRFTFLLSATSLIFYLSALPEKAQAQGGTSPGVPRFTDYPAGAKYTGRPAPVILRDKTARMFRTRLREGAQGGPNFAGHYTVVLWGCGSGCYQLAVVDSRTGVVYWPPFSNIAVGMLTDPEGDNPAYHIDSKLLIVKGSPDEESSREGTYYYLFDRNRFRLLRYVKAERPTQ